MSHDHPHDHDHDHSHNHTHSHDHSHTHSHSHGHAHSHSHAHDHTHDHGQEMTMEQKLLTLFSHWIDHNDSHKDNFSLWAGKARDAGFAEVADALDQAAAMSQDVTDKLRTALATLKKD